jgi:tetratricopeptide (TPR) repeat protein
MVKPKKKLSGKDLVEAPDQFITLSQRIWEFARDHRTAFTIFGCAVLLALASFLVVKSYLRTREEDAALEFGKAYSYFQSRVQQQSEKADTPLAIAYANALKQFEETANKYSRTNAGRMAMLYAAQCAYWAQQYDKAISYYQQYLARLRGDDYFRELAWSGLAYSYQAKGDCDKALEFFQKVVSANGFEKVYSYYNMAQCYEKLKDMDRAQQMLDKIKKEFPGSMLAHWIDAKSGKAPILE